MSIEKHPTRTGCFYVKSWPDGRNHPPHRDVVESWADAIALDALLKQSRPLKAVRTIHPRLDQAVDAYLAWIPGKWSPVTCATKSRRLENYIIPQLGKYRVRDLDQTILDSYATTVGRTTYHTDFNILFALIAWMRKRNMCDPALHFRPERPNPIPRKQVFPSMDTMVKAIETMAKEKHRILFYTMLFTALRWNEARNIRWENVKLTEGVIRICEIENGQEDLIPIPSPIIGWLETHKRDSGYVFEGREQGKPYACLWKVWGKAGEAVGLNIASHTFRRCGANHLYKITGDIHLVQRLLRHKKVQTTLRYIEQSIEAQERSTSLLVSSVVNNKNAVTLRK